MKENLEGRMLGREQEYDKSAPDCDDLAMTWRGLSQQLSDNRIAERERQCTTTVGTAPLYMTSYNDERKIKGADDGSNGSLKA